MTSPKDEDQPAEEPAEGIEPSHDRLTGRDVEAGLRRWRARTREQLTPQLGRRLTVGALVMALLGVGAASGALETSYRTQYAANTERIATLQRDLDSAVGPATTTPGAVASATASSDGSDTAAKVAAKDLDAFIKRASTAATAVAEGQQRYAVLARAATTASASAGNGAPSADVLAMVDHRKDLADLWEASSLVVDDTDAYSYSSASALDDPSKIDPRFPWYVRYDATTASTPNSYSWSVKTVMPITAQDDSGATDSPLQADVVWVCRQTGSDQEVLAWASAVFDDTTGQFHDLALNVTTAGAQHRSTSSANASTTQKGNG